ncbi:uncharacterized transporter slc-17.2-like [Liolophura sinensis]|uniref:uncharacterized transporter slc-17.2-like n=1 Tax=Liolophura sinensis TaxID=3198878 RepID=UPI003158A366
MVAKYTGSVVGLQRYRMALVAFVGFTFVYILRTDFSVAILCMVKTSSRNMSGVDNASYNHSRDTTSCGDENSMGRIVSGQELRGEFEWDKQLQSRMLASFFYGYIVTQIAGGWFSRRYGGRRVIGYGMALCILTTLLMPVCARAHVALVFVLRVIAGLSTGVAFPAMHCLWGRWAPPLERTKLTAIHTAGPPIGNIVTFLVSGYLCSYGFDNGWPSIFYIFGGVACIWLVCWFYVVYDTPEVHPRISASEKEYIEASIGDRYLEDEKRIKTPWGAMMKSPALWANIVAHFCNNWSGYSLLTGLPMYMREVLNFDIKRNGALSAVPYICMFVSSLVTGYVADNLRERNVLSTVNTRRVFQCTAFFGLAVFMIATGYTRCENRMLAVVFLSLATSFQALCRSGYLVNHIDIGPRYAGEMLGITNTAATLPGMIAPIVNAALTPDKSQAEWQRVFFMCGGFAVIGGVVFGVFVRGEVQPWARTNLQTEHNKSLREDEFPVITRLLTEGYVLEVLPPNENKGNPHDVKPLKENETSEGNVV